jgi:signal transduction histidine kinase
MVRGEATRPETIQLGLVLSAMRPLLERLVGEGIEVFLSLDPDVAGTAVDREAFEHVLLNLVANARDAMPRGGRVSITTFNVKLGGEGADASLDGQGYVGITVSGMGMSAEVRDRIFDPFFTTKGATRGTGLGLAMVHGFARQSGGCVSVHSVPEQGTTILLYLPRAALAASRLKLDAAV